MGPYLGEEPCMIKVSLVWTCQGSVGAYHSLSWPQLVRPQQALFCRFRFMQNVLKFACICSRPGFNISLHSVFSSCLTEQIFIKSTTPPPPPPPPFVSWIQVGWLDKRGIKLDWVSSSTFNVQICDEIIDH